MSCLACKTCMSAGPTRPGLGQVRLDDARWLIQDVLQGWSLVLAGFGNLPGEMAFHEVKNAQSYPLIASTRCAIPCPCFVTHQTLASPVCRTLKLQGSAGSCASACSALQHHQGGLPSWQAPEASNWDLACPLWPRWYCLVSSCPAPVLALFCLGSRSTESAQLWVHAGRRTGGGCVPGSAGVQRPTYTQPSISEIMLNPS